MDLRSIIVILFCCFTANGDSSNEVETDGNNLTKSSSKDQEGRIVGGGFATIKKYPHSAFLSIQNSNKNNEVSNWMCGSSILNQYILLSAGHCVEDCVKGNKCTMIATVGNVEKYNGTIFAVENFRLHEQYNGVTVDNDISLLKLLEPLKMGQTVSRVSIMVNPPMNEAASLAGWGVIDESKEIDTELLKYLTDIKVMDREACIKIVETVPKGAFCASRSGDDNNYAAEGDSGSALIVRGFIQIGLVSFKNPALSRSIIIYTDVAKYHTWVKDSSKALFCGFKD